MAHRKRERRREKKRTAGLDIHSAEVAVTRASVVDAASDLAGAAGGRGVGANSPSTTSLKTESVAKVAASNSTSKREVYVSGNPRNEHSEDDSSSDEESPPTNNEACNVNVPNCLEDFVVSHIVSDKTGTLTKNEMVFRGLGIGNGLCIYGVPKDCGLYGKKGKISKLTATMDQNLLLFGTDNEYNSRAGERPESNNGSPSVGLDERDGLIGVASGAAGMGGVTSQRNSITVTGATSTVDVVTPAAEGAMGVIRNASKSYRRFTSKRELQESNSKIYASRRMPESGLRTTGGSHHVPGSAPVSGCDRVPGHGVVKEYSNSIIMFASILNNCNHVFYCSRPTTSPIVVRRGPPSME